MVNDAEGERGWVEVDLADGAAVLARDIQEAIGELSASCESATQGNVGAASEEKGVS